MSTNLIERVEKETQTVLVTISIISSSILFVILNKLVGSLDFTSLLSLSTTSIVLTMIGMFSRYGQKLKKLTYKNIFKENLCYINREKKTE